MQFLQEHPIPREWRVQPLAVFESPIATFDNIFPHWPNRSAADTSEPNSSAIGFPRTARRWMHVPPLLDRHRPPLAIAAPPPAHPRLAQGTTHAATPV